MAKKIRMCVISKPTKKADMVADAMMRAMSNAGVGLDDFFPVLGEVCLRTIDCVSRAAGRNTKMMVHDFGRGLMNAEIECND